MRPTVRIAIVLTISFQVHDLESRVLVEILDPQEAWQTERKKEKKKQTDGERATPREARQPVASLLGSLALPVADCWVVSSIASSPHLCSADRFYRLVPAWSTAAVRDRCASILWASSPWRRRLSGGGEREGRGARGGEGGGAVAVAVGGGCGGEWIRFDSIRFDSIRFEWRRMSE